MGSPTASAATAGPGTGSEPWADTPESRGPRGARDARGRTGHEERPGDNRGVGRVRDRVGG